MIYIIILFALARMVDTATTLFALHHGFKELNPLMKWIVANDARAWVFTILEIIAISFLVSSVPETVGLLIIVPGALVQTAVAIRGILLLRKHHVR